MSLLFVEIEEPDIMTAKHCIWKRWADVPRTVMSNREFKRRLARNIGRGRVIQLCGPGRRNRLVYEVFTLQPKRHAKA